MISVPEYPLKRFLYTALIVCYGANVSIRPDYNNCLLALLQSIHRAHVRHDQRAQHSTKHSFAIDRAHRGMYGLSDQRNK